MLDWWTRRRLGRLAMRKWSWFSLRTRPRSVRPKTSMSDGAGRGGSAEAAESAFMSDPYQVSEPWGESAAPAARSQGRPRPPERPHATGSGPPRPAALGGCLSGQRAARLAHHIGPILKGVLTAPVRPEAAACSVYPFPT